MNIFGSVRNITPDELKDKLNQVRLIDVRQPEEFTGELGHIPQAELIPLGTLPDEIERVPKDSTVVFVCRSGGRSGQAMAFAQQNGFENVVNLEGGMILWNEKGLTVETGE